MTQRVLCKHVPVIRPHTVTLEGIHRMTDRGQEDSKRYDFSSFGFRFRGVMWRMAFFPVCVGNTFWVAERECSILFSPRGRNCPVKRLWFIAIGAPNVFDGDVGNIYNFEMQIILFLCKSV